MGASLKMGASLNIGISPAFGLDLAYVIFKVKFTTNNIGLNYCTHAHPVRQVVARLKAVRVVQGHRGGERSARIARSALATASHAHDEQNRFTIQLIGTDQFAN